MSLCIFSANQNLNSLYLFNPLEFFLAVFDILLVKTIPVFPAISMHTEKQCSGPSKYKLLQKSMDGHHFRTGRRVHTELPDVQTGGSYTICPPLQIAGFKSRPVCHKQTNELSLCAKTEKPLRPLTSELIVYI